MVPNDGELNNDWVELILVQNDGELNNDWVELILVQNDGELNNDWVPNDELIFGWTKRWRIE